ncbi:MAG: prolyl oligopeptidase family serine peptidase [Acidimicrobiales bacterium]
MRRTAHPTVALAALLTAATLVLAACSGSSGSEGSGGSGSTTTAGNATTTAAPKQVRAAAAGKVATGDPTPSAGCGTTDTRSVVLEKQFLDDSDRWWLLTTPLEHDGKTPLPLVVDFHGLSEGANIHSKMSGFSPFALEHGFILATPNGTGTPTRWQISPDTKTNPDLQFTAAMLDQLEANLCVDTSRVYATGLSNGAFISSAVGCAMSDRFAAIAPVAGLLRPLPCTTSHPMPVLTFHGTADPILLFNGGVGDRLGEIMSKGIDGIDANAGQLPEADLDGPGYPANAKDWAIQNGCDGTYTDTKLTKTVTHRVYDGCPADGPVEFNIIDGGGHSWPGSEFSQNVGKVVGATDMSIDADELIWDFFRRFQLPQS